MASLAGQAGGAWARDDGRAVALHRRSRWRWPAAPAWASRTSCSRSSQSYYAGVATEEEGACPSPEIASVTHRKVLESSAERTLLRVRYSYFDPSRDDDASWQQVLLAERPCTGFAERDFTLERGRLGYKVVEHERRGRRPARLRRV